MIDYLEEIKKMIVQQFGLEEDTIEEESFLETDLNVTEFDLEDLIAQIEDKYEIEIPPEDYIKFKQVADIANYLYEHATNV
ncbi:MAG: phosphopantetheine-binding protein [Candidatus Curtissbacteria bacterium]|nr:phosphopantetheine-binding protein [Candidatus Curtissbacteria bacterium]